MAIKIYEKFAPRANPADGDYPYGSIKNESVPGAKDGTPLDAVWANDYAGFDAALLAQAGITPSGQPDKLGASQRVDAISKLTKRSLHGVTAMLEMTNVSVGDIISSGATKFKVINSPIITLADLIPLNGLWVEDFIESDDSRIGIQAAIDYAETFSRKITVKSAGGNFLIKSKHPTYNAGLVITKPARVMIDFGGGTVSLDVSSGTVAGCDAVLAIAPTTEGLSDDLSIKDIILSGGNWTNPNDRPKNVIKADYFTLRYGKIENVRAYFSRESNILMSAFVMEFTKVRARFAGVNHSNFDLVVDSLDGTTGGARTGYLMQGCTADYAGMHGFNFTGVNGHTYCALINCHADNIGRDDSGKTILANIPTSSGYNLENVRVFNLVSCGVEVSTRMLTGENCRSMSVDGLYGVNNGSTSGEAIDAAIKLSGYYEKVNLRSFQDRDPVSVISKKLLLTNPAAFNTNSVVTDGSIARSDIEYTGGEPSSSSTLVVSPEDIYVSGVRKGQGTGQVTGKPLTGNLSTNWFNQSQNAATQTFVAQGPLTNSPMLTVDNITANGYIGFNVQVTVGKASGSIAVAPAVYAGSAGSHQVSAVVSPLALISGPADSYAVSISWIGSSLCLSCSDTSSVIAVEITAIGTPFSETKTFSWA